MKSPRIGVLTHGYQHRLEIRALFLPENQLASMQLSGLENKVHPQEAFRALSLGYGVAILRPSWWGPCNWQAPCMVGCLTWPHPELPYYTEPPFIIVAARLQSIYGWVSQGTSSEMELCVWKLTGESESHSVVSDSLRPHGLELPRLLCPILQARILEWVAVPFSRGSSPPRDWTWVSCIAGRFFTIWAMPLIDLGSMLEFSSYGGEEERLQKEGLNCSIAMKKLSVNSWEGLVVRWGLPIEHSGSFHNRVFPREELNWELWISHQHSQWIGNEYLVLRGSLGGAHTHPLHTEGKKFVKVVKVSLEHAKIPK